MSHQTSESDLPSTYIPSVTRHVSIRMFDFDENNNGHRTEYHQNYYFPIRASRELAEHDLIKIFRAMGKELDNAV